MKSLCVSVAVLLTLGGCKTVLMKTPAVVAAGKADPFEHVVPEWQHNRAPIFVASTRTVSGKSDPAQVFTNDRSRDIQLGLATVEIGPGLTWEELIQESLAEKRRRNPTLKVTAYEAFGPLWTTAWPPDYHFHRDWEAPGVDREPAERFVKALEEALAASHRKQITIFVHGFNTKFSKNLEVASEFWHYMSRDDVMMSFDWPSEGSMFSYQADKANANFAIRQFRRLLEFLADATSASQINIIAHSAGNPVVVEALRQLSLMYYDLDDDEAHRRSKIGRVVLAAPDMDLDAALSAEVDGAARITQAVAVYASRQDAALGFSSDIFGDIRLGRSIGKLTPEERAALIATHSQWIDVTAAQRRAPSFLGHSYFHQSPWVASDIIIFLRLDAPPEERGLVRDEKTGFLIFPDDYEAQLPEIVERLRAKYDPGG